ncbi:MAG: hypothetical protein HKN29_11025 [Rhodothermales bacterium]|nr:hypothetical protein [Rhodothermales bacterium]
MKRVLILLVLVCTATSANAHPWGGLVVDAAGSVYFTFVSPIVGDGHVACVWRLDPGASEPVQALRATSDPSDLVLARDNNRVVYAAERVGSEPFQTRLWRFSPDGSPELILPFVGASQFNADPYAVDTNGSIYFQNGGAIWKRTIETGPERWIEAPDRLSSLLAVQGESILQVKGGVLVRDGELIADNLKLEDPPRVPFSGANILFDVAADSTSTYLAYYGNREVFRVDQDGSRHNLLESESPWSPSGVDVYQGTVFVLESVTPAPAWKFWQDSTLRPRIRMVSPSGEVRALWKYMLN